MRNAGIILFCAAMLASCSFDESGRVFNDAAPRVIDASVGVDGFAGPDAAVDAPLGCPAQCTSCDQTGTCVIDCDQTNCDNGVTCPPGRRCEVSCNGDNECGAGVSCSAATSCDITCNGDGACAGGITCGGVSCTIECNGEDACTGDIACNAVTCDIDCRGDDVCEGSVCCLGSDCGSGCQGNCTCQ